MMRLSTVLCARDNARRSEDPLKRRQWNAFAIDLDSAPRHLQTVIGDITNFLMNAAAAAASHENIM